MEPIAPWAEFGFSSWGGGKTKDYPVHGGAKQRMIKYRLCRRYDWMQKLRYSNIETFSCMRGGLNPPSP